MPTEIAYFTPKTKSGQASLIDFWNVEHYDGPSDLDESYDSDQIEFRISEHSWKDEIDVGYANGVVQAYFKAPVDDYYLAIVKLSAKDSLVFINVDGVRIGSYLVEEVGQEVPVMVQLKKGYHTINVIQIKYWRGFPPFVVKKPTSPLTFHSITVFQV